MAEPETMNTDPDVAVLKAINDTIHLLDERQEEIGDFLLVYLPKYHKIGEDIPTVSSGFYRTPAHGVDLTIGAVSQMSGMLECKASDLIALLSGCPFAQDDEEEGGEEAPDA